MPPNLRHHYTEGQRAVLCIIAGEVKHHGICDLPIDKERRRPNGRQMHRRGRQLGSIEAGRNVSRSGPSYATCTRRRRGCGGGVIAIFVRVDDGCGLRVDDGC